MEWELIDEVRRKNGRRTYTAAAIGFLVLVMGTMTTSTAPARISHGTTISPMIQRQDPNIMTRRSGRRGEGKSKSGYADTKCLPFMNIPAKARLASMRGGMSSKSPDTNSLMEKSLSWSEKDDVERTMAKLGLGKRYHYLQKQNEKTSLLKSLCEAAGSGNSSLVASMLRRDNNSGEEEEEEEEGGTDTRIRKSPKMTYLDVINGDGEELVPLNNALENKDRKSAEVLIAFGADVNAKGKYGICSLIVGLFHEERGDRGCITRLLLDHGANPNACMQGGTTAVMIAVNEGLCDSLRMLLTCGADINAKRADKFTAVHIAAGMYNDNREDNDNHNNEDLQAAAAPRNTNPLDILIDHGGCNFNAVDDEGFTPLIYAILQSNFKGAIRLLDAGVDADYVLPSNFGASTALCFAMDQLRRRREEEEERRRRRKREEEEEEDDNDHSHYGMCQRLIRTIIMQGRERGEALPLLKSPSAVALSCAVRTNDIQGLKMLLSAGFDVDFMDVNGYSALHTCAAGWNSSSIAVRQEEEMARILIAHNATIDIRRSHNSKTPFHMAAEEGSIAIMRLLLEAGADVKAKIGGYELTALHLAIRHHKLRATKLLIERGADVNAVDANGCTPLYIAAHNNFVEAVELLIKAGADLNVKANLIDAQLRKLNLTKEENEQNTLDPVESEQETALFAAVYNNNFEAASRLVYAGADPLVPNWRNITSWMLAVSMGNLAIVKLFVEVGGVHPDTVFPAKSVPKASKYDEDALLVSGLDREIDTDEAEARIESLGKGYPTRLDQIDPTDVRYEKFKSGDRKLYRPSLYDRGIGILRGISALHIAATFGYEDILQYLLTWQTTWGVDVNKRADQNVQPLHLAALFGQNRAANILIQAGADLNRGDDSGYTPLIHATKKNHLDVVKSLLAAGANLNKISRLRWTALMFASANCFLEEAKILVKAGTNLSVHDYENRTAITMLSEFYGLDLLEIARSDMNLKLLEEKVVVAREKKKKEKI